MSSASFRHLILSALAGLGLALSPAPGLGESVVGSGARGASATLGLRVVIPPIVRVEENSHPMQLDTLRSGAFSGEQKLVVVSTMQHGFCITLRVVDPQWSGWQVQTPPQNGVSLATVSDGYRLCTTRPGRYALQLRHEFASAPAHWATARWPIQTDLTAI